MAGLSWVRCKRKSSCMPKFNVRRAVATAGLAGALALSGSAVAALADNADTDLNSGEVNAATQETSIIYVANGGVFADGGDIQFGVTDADGYARQPLAPPARATSSPAGTMTPPAPLPPISAPPSSLAPATPRCSPAGPRSRPPSRRPRFSTPLTAASSPTAATPSSALLTPTVTPVSPSLPPARATSSLAGTMTPPAPTP